MAHNLIRQMDQTPECGWIVNLQNNGGGNMWPMLAAVGPILGEGKPAGFLNSGYSQTWAYSSGKILIDGQAVSEVTVVPYAPKRPDLPVVVLISNTTRNASEAVDMAFIGRPNVRFFAEPTGGFTTGNSGIDLGDGALLALTIAFMNDRSGKAYDGPINPDVSVGGPSISPALEWLRAQPSYGS